MAALTVLALGAGLWLRNSKRFAETLDAISDARSQAARVRLARRIDGGFKSPAFRDWLSELTGQRLEASEVLDLLAAEGISNEQKVAVLEHFADQSRGAGFRDADLLRERLGTLLQQLDIPADLGLKIGRLLNEVSTPESRGKLETHYERNRSQLPEGNKLAIVMGSRSERFLASVVDDRDEDISVRERSLSRLARLGELEHATAIAAGTDPTEDPRLKLTAMRVVGMHAQDVEQLEKLANDAKRPAPTDELGRNAADLAHVGISESKVPGKSAVMFDSWASGVLPLNTTSSEDDLLRVLVLGKALSRALWTESSPELVETLLEERLLPFARGTLERAAPTSNVPQMQAIADFSAEFRRECASRPVPACEDEDDPRPALADGLQSLVAPHVLGTELAFYLQ